MYRVLADYPIRGKKTPCFYAKKGDIVKLITEDARPWRVAVIVENSKKERFSVKIKDIVCLS